MIVNETLLRGGNGGDVARAHIQQLMASTPDTVPSSVTCKKVKRCDRRNVCVITCKPGSVHVDTWLQNSLKVQRKLAFRRSLCSAQLPGTHNSAINMADGYGVEDHVFEGYLKYLSWFKPNMRVHTNDQLFSLTDQMRMGVRFIELDVHWFDDDLRIAHCGGFHSSLLDDFVAALNKIAHFLGTDIQWDSGTIGCKPSLSSIPADEQRHLGDALKEVAAWLHAQENQDEFLLVFFDDESDLFRWKKVRTLLKYLKEHFAKEEMFVPADLKRFKGWPTPQELLKVGKRVMFMSGSNYSPRGDEILFVKSHVCDWTEPSLPFEPYPTCRFKPSHEGPSDSNSTIFRPETSEIEYGFLNADGHLGPNEYLLTEKSLPPLLQCGVNIPSPDNVTPKRMESMVWAFNRASPLAKSKCVGLTRKATYWHSVDCGHPGYVAACVSASDTRDWKLTKTPVPEKEAAEACTLFGAGFAYSVPSSGYENHLLLDKLAHAPSNIQGVWIDVKDLVHEAFFANDEDAEKTAIENSEGSEAPEGLTTDMTTMDEVMVIM
ncbi:TPA: hypothetical protein N0F65_006917 [Lagenidium giganteum]|uniref:PLC-like phosphodiesterase n=1 Tax=Lagenidium giganteum TaxID=4803 RepID=A0AAV2ZH17_9STRA|nr:TPA: hypothetical protein N0F65_006917 [Lagenidium giganteum]